MKQTCECLLICSLLEKIPNQSSTTYTLTIPISCPGNYYLFKWILKSVSFVFQHIIQKQSSLYCKSKVIPLKIVAKGECFVKQRDSIL